MGFTNFSLDLYVPDPTFSVLSRKGTPKDITQGGGKRSVYLTRANPDRGLTAIVPTEEVGGLSSTDNPAFWVYIGLAEKAFTGSLESTQPEK